MLFFENGADREPETTIVTAAFADFVGIEVDVPRVERELRIER